jgi:DNA-directed RNA polymerase subunit L
MADDEETEYISVVQVAKLIPKSFDGNPKCLREFCEGVEAARQVVHPLKQPMLLKFIESKITGEAKDRLLARTQRHTWEQIKAILEETYAVKRTLENYAGILFTAQQRVNETVAQWGSRVDKMGIDLIREAGVRIKNINPRVVEGGSILVSEFKKGTFIAGLKDDRIKYIVKAKGEDNSLAQLVETALQEENSFKSQKWKENSGGVTRPNQKNVGSLRFCKPQGGEYSNLCQVL